ncbi:response regulator [Virgibacillus oceani]|uniref:AraC family transcriptional regulator n=1 Tax=Virgibacillus oceani TaxID=1479511 RepID=A0A917HQ40_9BACI|nr:response regulator [Virgibacillus oceani]GGG85795.1 AraC family transcriptional regulator [Virgibacillus oceani]
MRVLIAEDELLERKAMRKFIEDNFAELTVVGEAPNGRKAIELAGAHEPDIIFMDIKMPGINGLEAVEEIIRVNPATKFILVSAYDSFDYAKQAMKFGIKEYILKPGKKEEIVKAILRVQKEIAAEKKQRAEQVQSNQLIKEHLITKLMKYPIDDDAITIQKQFFAKMKSSYFLVVQVGNEVSEELIETVFNKSIEFPFIVNHNGDSYTICVFPSVKVDKAEILHVARKVQLELGSDSFVGAGLPCASIEDLPKSYQEALHACYQLERENNRNYGFVLEKEKHLTYRDSLQWLLEAIEKGDDMEAIRLFNENQDNFAQNTLDELYLYIKSIMIERGIAVVERTLSELTKPKDWEKFIKVCCLQIQDYYQSKQYIVKAKKYVRENFQQAITLEETAAHVNLSPNYFSNMFKREFGSTFIDYVTKVRLQKAKELIEGNNYSLKEISYMIGYKDPNYFSRVFKKQFLVSPKRFQQQILKK